MRNSVYLFESFNISCIGDDKTTLIHIPNKHNARPFIQPIDRIGSCSRENKRFAFEIAPCASSSSFSICFSVENWFELDGKHTHILSWKNRKKKRKKICSNWFILLYIFIFFFSIAFIIFGKWEKTGKMKKTTCLYFPESAVNLNKL